MKRFARALVVTLAVVTLGSTIALLPQKNALGAGGAKPVTVVNTPLPVTGNVNANVTNASLPVNVLNTPLPTTVTNTPSVTVSGTPTVSFSNTSSTPLFVQDVDNPALQPFAAKCLTTTFDSSGRAQCSPLPGVPAGKRFVIETVSGQLQITSGTRPIQIDLQLCAAGTVTDNFFPATFQGNSAFFTGDFFVVNQRVRLYADSTGGGCTVFAIVISNSTSGAAELVVSGYLVNMP